VIRVADAGRRFDHFGLSELALEAADRDLERLDKGIGVLVPDASKEVGGAQVGGAPEEERLEHSELLDREAERTAVAGVRLSGSSSIPAA
jgi:hypothetical protein